jgi:carboxylate-amine ligase
MAPDEASWTVGIEEEYQIIDPVTGELCPQSDQLLPQVQPALGQDVQPELYQAQIETASRVSNTLADIRAELVRLRRALVAAAANHGKRIGAAGTHPFSRWSEQPITPKPRYQGIAQTYRQLADELIIFGCHVHVGLDDRDGAIQVLNRVRPWLAPLLALAANSPFWQGQDTGYASYRTELWSRFPMAGPPCLFTSRAEYDTLIRTLVATGSIEDASKIYWDVRLPERFATVEFRVTDVCLTVDEAVMVTGLVRALARTCYEQACRNELFSAVRPELLRAAHWRAARFGLDGDLIDVVAEASVPAHTLIKTFLAFVRPALEASHDWDEVASLVHDTLQHGNGATRQRRAYQQAGRIEDVVDLILAETAKGLT